MENSPESSSGAEHCASGDWLVGGGEMGKSIRSIDWSKTPLGPIDSWPPSLRTTVSLALNSNFPISLAWGAHHTQIYNDGYWPICAAKHPASMGQDFSECWASAWPVIGEAFNSALAGTTAFLEDQRMFLDRLGYLEETFFTFSFSPIRDESGKVAGLFHPVTETTSKMVGQRRTRTLRDLAASGLKVKAQSLEHGLQVAAQTLAESELDLPFVLFYRLDANGMTAHLAAQTGLPPGGPASPVTVDLGSYTAGWPLAQAAATGVAVQVDDVRERFGALACGPYPEPINSALVHSLKPAGHEQSACIMVTGVSTRLPMNEAYRSFYDLLASAVTTVIANAIASEAERQRAEALAELDRAKTAFFSNVSHEFRTPLTLILGPLEDELAERRDVLPPARRERLQTAHRNSLRLLKLVNTLLDFARIEAGRVEAVFEPTDLAALTAELAGNFRSACERGGLQFTVDCPPLPQPVYVDHDMWEKIVLNLLSNAFKFTLEGGIAVSLRPSDHAVELSVRDTGTGIPPEELPKVFDRFHRVKSVQARTHEGTGIGLALVKELAGLHGGSIRADSVYGQGSTFAVSIPLGHAHLPAERIGAARNAVSTALGAGPFVEEALRWLPASAAASTAEPTEESRREPRTLTSGRALPAPEQQTRTGGRPRIVWADDNADMREYVLRLLSESYDVEAVADGEEALAAVRRAPPALVLSDVMMPRLDGFGLLRELRADERIRTVPIVLLSARAGEESRIEGLEAGADDYLVKPFSARELLARVGAHVELAGLRREAEAARGAAEKAEALQASETQLRLITDAVPALISYVDSTRRYRFHNLAYEEWFGHSRAELYGKQLEEVLGEDVYRTIAEHVEATLAGRSVTYEAALPYRDGGTRFVHAAYVPDVGADGKVKGFFALVSDITEHKQIEAALQASEQRFRQLAESLPQLVWTCQPDGLCDFLSRQWIEYTGIPAAEQLGFGWLQQVHADDREATIATWNAAVASGSDFRTEFRVRRRDGVYRWFDTRAVRLRDADGSTVKWFGSNTDISDRKLAEESQMRSQKMEALGTLAGGIAHDFNNLLLAIAGNAALAVADLPADHPAQESLVEISQASARATDLVRRILAFTRQQEIKRQVVLMQPVVEEALRLLRSMLPAMIEIKATFAEGVPAVAADSTQVHQIIINLATNAAHAIGGAAGRIDVALDAVTVNDEIARTSVDLHEGRYTRLSVSDNGCGIDQATLERIFDPFFTTKPPGQGTGLGLSAVHGIMRSHQGAITVYSQPGKGTTFRAYFPAAEEPLAQARAVRREVTRGRGERVLYIDDESALVSLTTRMLRRLGYEVSGHAEPAAALQALKSNPQQFDVVVTDLSMPGMSGFDVAAEVRALRADIPILMTSGYLRPEDQEMATRLGIREVILKPNTVEELGAALERLFRRADRTGNDQD